MKDIAKKTMQVIQNANKKKTTAYDSSAVVTRIDRDNKTAWVHIAGGVDETPVKLTVDAKKGDTVQVRVGGGRAWLTGNATNPPTDDTTANAAMKKAAIVGESLVVTNRLVADKADISDLNAAKAWIGELEVDTAKIHDLTATQLSATVGYIEDLTSRNVTALKLVADDAVIDSLDTNYAHITNGVIDNAKIGYADVNDLCAHYATIDFENVNNSWITNGTIKNAAISDAMISGVSANKLTAGTIDASNITVTNLNASNITAGSITVDGITIDIANNEASIDGAYVEEGTITLSGLAQEVTDKIDGAIESFTGSAVPTLNNYPASGWSVDERASHVGDVYYVVNSAITEDGYCYRFTHSNNAYSWTLIKDSDVTAALSRLTTAEGNITNLQTFEMNTESWITDADDELASLQQRTTTLETDIGDKVDVTTFNTLSQSVDTNTANITSLSTTVQNKADSSTVTTLSNTVSTVQQTANGNSSKLSNLITVLGTNADGTTSTTDVVHRTSALEQDLSGFKTTVASTYYTQSDASALTGRVTSAESNITQNANAITTKVSQDGVISSINQSPESVTIDASRINVTGVIQVGGIATTTQVDDAATKATNYLSPDGTGKVKVHPKTGTNNYVQIDNTGMTVYKGGNDMAFFGDTARVGRNATGYSRTEISSDGVQFIRGATIMANIGYGEGTDEDEGQSVEPFYTMGVRAGNTVGNWSMAEGYLTTATGYCSHAEGIGTNATGANSHAEGEMTTASEEEAHAEGWRTTASEWATHAEGYHTTASGVAAHAEGTFTKATSTDSHAEGYYSEGNGAHSHAEGYMTKANGLASHAEGYYATASHEASHAGGKYTTTSRISQTVIGEFNADDSSALFIIGNGTSGESSDRKNAFTVDASGNVNILSGAKYKINGTALSASDVGAVPTSRTVNSKALSSNITLTASDVGALATSGGNITGNLSYKSSTIDASLANNGVSSTQYPTTFNILDKSNRILTRKEAMIESNGNISAYWYVRNYNTSGTQVGQKGIKITMDKTGAVTYTVDDSSKFLSALSMNKYTRSSVGHLDWSNQTDGDSHAIMKSALAFWNGRFNATQSNLAYCNKGAFGTLATKNSLSASEVGAVARSVCCYANSRVDTFSSSGQVTIPLANLGITNGAKPVGILMTYQDGGATPTILRYDYDASNSTNVIIKAYNSSGRAVSGAVRYFAMVFQGSWTTP